LSFFAWPRVHWISTESARKIPRTAFHGITKVRIGFCTRRPLSSAVTRGQSVHE